MERRRGMAGRLLSVGLMLVAGGETASAAKLSGQVVGEDGSKVAGAVVTATRIAPLPPLRVRAVSQADGSYLFPSLEAGSYRFCIWVADGSFLDPREWEPPRREVTLAAGETKSVDQRVFKAAKLEIRLNDPQKLLEKNLPATGRRPPLLLGVFTGLGHFVATTRTARDTAGEDHSVAIPFDVPVPFNLTSPLLRMRDGTNRDLAAAGTVVMVEQKRGESSPKRLTFNITGTR